VRRLPSLRFFLACMLLAALIYGFRYYRAVSAPSCSDLCKFSNHTSDLNEDAFRKTVVPQLKSPNLYNLIVFVDPDKDCLACLFETEYWLAAEDGTDSYTVHFFIPHDSPDERVEGYRDQFLLEDDQILRFDPKGPLAPYHAYGVFKVFYDIDAGVRWYEFGNQDERAQIALAERIKQSIEKEAN